VSLYRYLGVTLTPSLSFRRHVREKVGRAKLAINTVWSKLINKVHVPLNAKYELYRAIFCANVLYAAQVWGFQLYDELDGFQRFFVKKLFGVPECTPNYMVDLETGLPPLFTYTWETHSSYCMKVLQLPDYRLVKIVAGEVIRNNQYWFLEWTRQAMELGVSFDPQSTNALEWGPQLREIKDKLIKRNEEWALNQASRSERRPLYRHLVSSHGDFWPLSCKRRANLKGWEARWLFKIRGELLYLNDRDWGFSVQGSRLCSLCNTNAREDTFHFLAVCPILALARKSIMGKTELSRQELLEYLTDTKPCNPLLLFCRVAWKLRHGLVQEFNY